MNRKIGSDDMLDEEFLESNSSNEEQLENKNEIIEITDEGEDKVLDDSVKTSEEKPKIPKKNGKWSKLDKKKKIIIIASVCGIVLLVLGLVLYFVLFKKNEADNDEESSDEPIVIVEKDNYRYEDGKLVFINDQKNELGTYECENKNENLCYIAYYSNEDLFDVPEHVYENGSRVEKRSEVYSDRYVFVYDSTTRENGDLKLYDIDKQEVIDNYKLVKKIDDTEVIVKTSKDKYGVLKLENDYENIVEMKYDYLGYIDESLLIVAMQDLKYSLLDLSGKSVTKTIPGEIKNFNDEYLSVLIDKEYYIYNYNGVKQDEKGYNYVSFHDDYVVGINSRKIFVYDKDLTPLNLVGVKISTGNYNTKIVFDQDKKQIKKEEAYSLSVNNGSVKVIYGDQYKDINVYEGKLSKRTDYLSYYDGVLYIYSDKDKTNLLGSYACVNPNVIDSSTSEFNNCAIARESAFLNRDKDIANMEYLPIYNKRYAFIQDNPSVKEEDTIVLWDLKQNSKKATYTGVDAGYYSKGKVNFVDTANTLVMAKNTSGSYGVVRIEAANVSGIISFKEGNEEIRFLKENILTKRKDGTYHLYDLKGQEITNSNSEIKSEIVDYNDKYLLVKNEDVYTVYAMDGKVIGTEQNLKYIELWDKFFVGIDKDDKIYLFTYEGVSVGELENRDVVNKNDFSKAYKVSIVGNEVVLSVLDLSGNVVSSMRVVI